MSGTTLVAAGVFFSAAGEAAGGAGGGGANWYLRSPDGSRQGPYGLPQLAEWSSSGYVSPGWWFGCHDGDRVLASCILRR